MCSICAIARRFAKNKPSLLETEQFSSLIVTTQQKTLTRQSEPSQLSQDE